MIQDDPVDDLVGAGALVAADERLAHIDAVVAQAHREGISQKGRVVKPLGGDFAAVHDGEGGVWLRREGAGSLLLFGAYRAPVQRRAGDRIAAAVGQRSHQRRIHGGLIQRHRGDGVGFCGGGQQQRDDTRRQQQPCGGAHQQTALLFAAQRLPPFAGRQLLRRGSLRTLGRLGTGRGHTPPVLLPLFHGSAPL